VIDPNTLDYRAPGADAAPRSGRGRGFLALAATVLIPGLGQIIAGEKRRGLKWLGAFLLILATSGATLFFHRLFPAMVLLVPLQWIVVVAAWIDAYRVGKRSTRPMLGRPALRYVVGGALLLLALTANPQVMLAMLMRTYLAETFIVPPVKGMAPTLEPGDRFIAHKRIEPRRWDVVAFRAPPEPDGRRNLYVKRLVGLPGERLEIIDGDVHINGHPLPRPSGVGPYESTTHVGPRNGCQGNPITLGADEYFLLGDNSPISGDSRYWTAGVPGHQPGTVGRADIVGRGTYIYWPPSRWRRLSEN
jgi:signal peptidase I